MSSLIGLRDEPLGLVSGQDLRKTLFLLLSGIDSVHRTRMHPGDEFFFDRPGVDEIDGVLESANKNERLSRFLTKSQNLAAIPARQLRCRHAKPDFSPVPKHLSVVDDGGVCVITDLEGELCLLPAPYINWR